MRRIAILVGLLMLVAGNAEAGIYRTATSSQGGEDSIAITFVVKDSIANPITGVTGDSIFIAVFHPGGALAVRDSGRLINSTTATGKLSSAAWRAGTGVFTVYCYATQVSVAAGTTRPGVYPYVLTIRDSSCCVAGGGVMYTFKEGEAQVYTSTTHTFATNQDSVARSIAYNTYLAAKFDSTMDSLSKAYILNVYTTVKRDSTQDSLTYAALYRLYNTVKFDSTMDSLTKAYVLNAYNTVKRDSTQDSLTYAALYRLYNTAKQDSTQDSVARYYALAAYNAIKFDSTMDSLAKAYILNVYNTVKRDSTQDSLTYAALYRLYNTVKQDSTQDSVARYYALAAYNAIKFDSTMDSLIKAYVLNVYNTVKYDSTMDSLAKAYAKAMIDTTVAHAPHGNDWGQGAGASDPSTYWRDTLNQLLTAAKAMRDSGQYYAQTGSSGTGPQTLTVTVIDTSGTVTVVPGVNLSIQNLAQDAVLWSTGSNGTNSLGIATGNNQVSTAIAIVGYLPGYTFPVFKDTTGAGTTFADTIRGYNIAIDAPTASNVKRVYGYEYNGVDTLQGIQVLAVLINPALTGDSVVVDTSTGVQYSAGMQIAPTSGWTTANGYWYLDLPLNSNISPFGTRWDVIARNTDGTTRWKAQINVTNTTTDCIGHVTGQTDCP